MDDINIFLSYFLFLTSFITLCISIFTFQFRKNKILTYLGLLSLAITIYLFGYGMELISPSFKTIWFWNQIQYIGLPFIPTFWLFLAIYNCKKDYLFTPFKLVLLFTIPIITILSRYTNYLHHLYYTNITFESDGLFPIVWLEKGPFYFLFIGFSTIVFFYSNYLYYTLYSRSITSKPKNLLLFTASLFPFFTILMNAFNFGSGGIDVAALSIAISVFFLIIGTMRFDLFITLPIAKEKIFETSSNAILILDYAYYLIDYNLSAQQIFNGLHSEVIGLYIGDALEAHKDFVLKVLSSNHFHYHCDDIYVDGHVFPFTSKKNRIKGYVIMLNNVTKYHNAMHQLEKLATRDELTSIFNRRYLLDTLEREIIRAKRYQHPLSIALIDFDHFKSINDKYGHLVGDEVLKYYTNLISQHIRSTDIFGRYGGEEFIIIFPESTVEDSLVLCKRIQSLVANAVFYYQDLQIPTTISIGISGGVINPNTASDMLISEADHLLYNAKTKGRNCVEYK